MTSFEQIAGSAVASTLLKSLPALDAIILFGSTATGHARADSDVDIAVFGAAPYGASQLFDARMACETVLRKQVDLVDLRKARCVARVREEYVAAKDFRTADPPVA